MGIPDQQTCFLRNLYGGQEATARTGHVGTTVCFQTGKRVNQENGNKKKKKKIYIYIITLNVNGLNAPTK